MNYQKQFILALTAYASQRDVDAFRACHLSGIDLAHLADAAATISPLQIESLWKNLVHLSGDPLFGLHFGESMQLAALGVIGQIIHTSRSVGEALTTASSLVPLITELITIRIEQGNDTCAIHFLAAEGIKEMFPVSYRQMSDYLTVFVVHEMDGLMLRKISPVAGSIPHQLLSDAEQEEYNRILRCNGVVVGDAHILWFRASDLNEVIISGNYELQKHLLKTIQHLMPEKGDDSGSLRSRVYAYLLSNSYLCDSTVDATAANFNMSARTLQRRLTEEGTTFQEILEQVKCNLAVAYLSSGHHQVKEIAFMLGYQEQNALIRAFKRWTGKTPGEYVASQPSGRV